MDVPLLWEEEPRSLLPCDPQDEHPGWMTRAPCEPAPEWLDAVMALWREVHEEVRASADPAAQALCRRLSPDARAVAYRAAVQDPSGRVLQLVEVQPAAAAVVARVQPAADEPSPWEAVVAGQPLREVLARAASLSGYDAPAEAQRLYWLARRVPPDTPPLPLLEVIGLPLITSDLPAEPEQREMWLGAMMRLARALRHYEDASLRRSATRYVSRHYAALRGMLGEGRLTWGDFALWMAATGRRPDRSLDPRRFFEEIMRWRQLVGGLRQHQQLLEIIAELERMGRDGLPAPPLPAFEDGPLRVKSIVSVRRLYEEGAEMRHCIFNHHPMVFAGFGAPYSVQYGDVRCSLMLTRDQNGKWAIGEVTGHGNRPPPDGLREHLRMWLTKAQQEDVRGRPIVFVDIDGVLAPFDLEAGWDPGCVAHLDEIVARSHALVVVTSAWRERATLEELRQAFQEAGFSGRVHDVTPILPGQSRGEEIRAYLEERADHPPFVILDDQADVEGLEDFLVQVDGDVGLQAEDVEAALRVFAQSTRR